MKGCTNPSKIMNYSVNTPLEENTVEKNIHIQLSVAVRVDRAASAPKGTTYEAIPSPKKRSLNSSLRAQHFTRKRERQMCLRFNSKRLI